jgi:transcriptional regulatory protein RtcR
MCSTCRNLRNLAARGSFREDLLVRVRNWEFELPNLTKRNKDIPDLLEYFLRRWNAARAEQNPGREFIPVSFTKKARKRFLRFAQHGGGFWFGNLRDLQQSVAFMASLALFESGSRSHCITDSIVDQVTKRLSQRWMETPFELTVSKNLPMMFVRLLEKDPGDLCLMDKCEKLLQEVILADCRDNKAAAGRRLYQSHLSPLSNPPDRFSKRWQLLRSKGTRGEEREDGKVDLPN